jgi:hypothetical protein
MNLHSPRALVALLLLALLAGCAAQSAAPTPAAPATPLPVATPAPLPSPSPAPTSSPASAPEPGQPFQVRVGETVVAGPVALTLLGITNDSRCPTQVACAWEGAAEASIDVVVDGRQRGMHTLTLFGQNRETEQSSMLVEGYTVRIVSLDPYPAEPQPIPETDYVALFIVEPAARTYAPVGDGELEGVIVPEGDAGAFKLRAEGYWTPSEQDVRALEAGLAEFLYVAALERSPDLWQKQRAYKRQYGGIVRAGRRLVYASFLCNTHGDEWRRQVVIVMDGGDCYFQLTFDVERDTFDDLTINGEA